MSRPEKYITILVTRDKTEMNAGYITNLELEMLQTLKLNPYI